MSNEKDQNMDTIAQYGFLTKEITFDAPTSFTPFPQNNDKNESANTDANGGSSNGEKPYQGFSGNNSSSNNNRSSFHRTRNHRGRSQPNRGGYRNNNKQAASSNGNEAQSYTRFNDSDDSGIELGIDDFIPSVSGGRNEAGETSALADLSQRTIVSTAQLRGQSFNDLIATAEKYGITNTNRMLKQDMICVILKQVAAAGEVIMDEGVVEVMSDGFGFLRFTENNYVSSADNVYISQNQVKKFGLRTGDTVSCYVREPKSSERYFSLLNVISINGHAPEELKHKINFDNLIPLFPKEKLNLDVTIGSKLDISTRVIDLIAPIGKGQRALIVAPPRSGKTVLMKNIAHAINTNHPEVVLIVGLIDERPEEVTDMIRSVKGEVVSSTFDEPAERHVALAEMVINKAKRMVEDKKDVVILLDSITRLARAYNTVVPSSGKVLTGGVDANALQRPKRFFGAARNTENGGSLTIIATALVDTGSKMDEVIFEEFKGTGNSEIVLDRKLSERRLFPAIDINKSGTRKEEEMVDADTLSKMWMLRRVVTKMNDQISSGSDALEFLIKKIKETSTNAEFFVKMNS